MKPHLVSLVMNRKTLFINDKPNKVVTKNKKYIHVTRMPHNNLFIFSIYEFRPLFIEL